MEFEITRPLEDQKQEAFNQVDQTAGSTRAKYITVAAGQEATYAEKEADARAYVADGYPVDASNYPWINTQALLMGITAREVADVIVYTADQWIRVGSQIEGERMAAKNRINSANTVVIIRELVKDFITTMGNF
jgi:hypothetical protein